MYNNVFCLTSSVGVRIINGFPNFLKSFMLPFLAPKVFSSILYDALEIRNCICSPAVFFSGKMAEFFEIFVFVAIGHSRDAKQHDFLKR